MKDNYIENFKYPENFFKYLGTSGGRFSMIKQARSTGGIWFRYGGINCVLDPGPGSLLRICTSDPQLDSESIDAVLLTHKHIDHSTDANVLIECMTRGGFDDRGTFVAPEDCVSGPDPVVLKYSLAKAKRVLTPRDGEPFELSSGVTAEPVMHLHHGVQCFGYIMRSPGLPQWGVISDTKYLPHLAERYKDCRYISINVTFPNRKARLDHMSVEELRELLAEIHPELVTLSHLGAMLTAPEDGAQYLKGLDTEYTKTVPGEDGMVIDLETLQIYRSESRQPDERYHKL